MEADEQRLRNQQEFRELLEKLGITQAQAAELITKESLRTVKARTVKSWLASSTARTAYPCPAWAIKVLRDVAKQR
jgi:uncharacterized protein YkwD